MTTKSIYINIAHVHKVEPCYLHKEKLAISDSRSPNYGNDRTCVYPVTQNNGVEYPYFLLLLFLRVVFLGEGNRLVYWWYSSKRNATRSASDLNFRFP